MLKDHRSKKDWQCKSYKKLQRALGTEDVACVIDAKHLCVNSRGISDIESSTVTSEFGGKFKDPQARREFLDYQIRNKILERLFY
jgi:GTP cyclohydrolase I